MIEKPAKEPSQTKTKVPLLQNRRKEEEEENKSLNKKPRIERRGGPSDSMIGQLANADKQPDVVIGQEADLGGQADYVVRGEGAALALM